MRQFILGAAADVGDEVYHTVAVAVLIVVPEMTNGKSNMVKSQANMCKNTF